MEGVLLYTWLSFFKKDVKDIINSKQSVKFYVRLIKVFYFVSARRENVVVGKMKKKNIFRNKL